MKWWQKKVRGWVVPFWYTDTPLHSRQFAELNEEDRREVANAIGELKAGKGKMIIHINKQEE